MPRLVSFSHTGGFGPGDKVSVTFEVGVSSSSSSSSKGRAKKALKTAAGSKAGKGGKGTVKIVRPRSKAKAKDGANGRNGNGNGKGKGKGGKGKGKPVSEWDTQAVVRFIRSSGLGCGVSGAGLVKACEQAEAFFVDGAALLMTEGDGGEYFADAWELGAADARAMARAVSVLAERE